MKRQLSASQDRFHLTDYGVLQEPSCSETDVIVFIYSLHLRQVDRNLIRQGFGRQMSNYKLKVIFVVDRSPTRSDGFNDSMESAEFKDMLKFNVPSYKSTATLRHILTLKWLSSNCEHLKAVIPHPSEVTKASAAFLSRFVRSWFSQFNSHANTIYCEKITHGVNLTAIGLTRPGTHDMCKKDTFFVMSVPVVKELLKVSNKVKYFPDDYVFVSLILRYKADVDITQIGKCDCSIFV